MKKSVASIRIEVEVLKAQWSRPVSPDAFIKSPEELITITSPCLVTAIDKKFVDFIKDETDLMSQILEPSLVSKQRILLS